MIKVQIFATCYFANLRRSRNLRNNGHANISGFTVTECYRSRARSRLGLMIVCLLNTLYNWTLQEQSEEQARASTDQKGKAGVVGGWSFGLTGLKRTS